MFSTWISITVFVICFITFLAILSVIWFSSDDVDCKVVQVKKLSKISLHFGLPSDVAQELHPRFLSTLSRVENKVNNDLPIIQLEVFKEHDIYAILTEISYNIKEAVNGLPSSNSKNTLAKIVLGMENPSENCYELLKINSNKIVGYWRSNGIKIDILIEGEFSIY